MPLAARAIAFAAIAAFPFAAMAAKKRSLSRATYSVVSWCFNAAGLVQGLLRPRRPPRARIASVVLHEPPQVAEAGQRQRIA
jgi:hypothetical protein